jgi:hypothetical protein
MAQASAESVEGGGGGATSEGGGAPKRTRTKKKVQKEKGKVLSVEEVGVYVRIW